VLRQDADAAMALAVLCCAHPLVRAWLPKPIGMAFLGGFFGSGNLERYTSVAYATPGLVLSICLGACSLLLPWSFYWPLAVARLGYWGWGWWRKHAQSFPVGPVLPGRFLGVVLLFFSAADTLNWLATIPAAGCLQERC